ncbi:uncharacterized protein NPIL_576981 [Nephila pilipes]|uniref:Uncharacterized protein n=1 Tax=Nephila pilipes TaxID=299642 RepID=A0A8X6NB78_NEPPI|nr:uncharacterized protein NPIL_576981 [Nephila pilipes]
MLNSALYIDDLYFGGNNVGESFELSTDAVSILTSGGFNLRKVRSNSRELEKLWVDNGLINVDVVGEHQLKVLGLNWNPEKDELSLENGNSTIEIIFLDPVSSSPFHYGSN